MNVLPMNIGFAAASKASSLSLALIKFSPGSHVLCSGPNPFHLTRHFFLFQLAGLSRHFFLFQLAGISNRYASCPICSMTSNGPTLCSDNLPAPDGSL